MGSDEIVNGRQVYILWATVLIAGILAGCGKENTSPSGACVLVLFDLSVGAQSVRDRYADGFSAVFQALDGGDTILADVITDQTQQTASFPINTVIPQFSTWTDDEQGYGERRQLQSQQVQETVRELLDRDAPNSDIMSGFVLAGKVFGGARGASADSKVLVVFTDAIEQTSECDFTAVTDLSDGKIDRVIKAEKAAGRLPDLSGVRVYMVGVNAMLDPNANMSRQKLAWVERFWLSYASATGAELDKANYTPSLINFSLRDTQ